MTSTAFLIIAFLTGIAGALQTPTLSLFLTSQVHVSPFMVGIFFTGSAVIGIFVSQLLASVSVLAQATTRAFPRASSVSAM